MLSIILTHALAVRPFCTQHAFFHDCLYRISVGYHYLLVLLIGPSHFSASKQGIDRAFLKRSAAKTAALTLGFYLGSLVCCLVRKHAREPPGQIMALERDPVAGLGFSDVPQGTPLAGYITMMAIVHIKTIHTDTRHHVLVQSNQREFEYGQRGGYLLLPAAVRE